VRVIRNPVNYSYPRSQNLGIAQARHDWLAFLNNDVIVSPGWDATLLNTMRQNGRTLPPPAAWNAWKHRSARATARGAGRPFAVW
jgi:GT2 family glycosyltransferase